MLTAAQCTALTVILQRQPTADHVHARHDAFIHSLFRILTPGMAVQSGLLKSTQQIPWKEQITKPLLILLLLLLVVVILLLLLLLLLLLAAAAAAAAAVGRSTETVHTSTKAHLTSVMIRIQMCIRSYDVAAIKI